MIVRITITLWSSSFHKVTFLFYMDKFNYLFNNLWKISYINNSLLLQFWGVKEYIYPSCKCIKEPERVQEKIFHIRLGQINVLKKRLFNDVKAIHYTSEVYSLMDFLLHRTLCNHHSDQGTFCVSYFSTSFTCHTHHPTAFQVTIILISP